MTTDKKGTTFAEDRRTVLRILKETFGEENVSTTPEECMRAQAEIEERERIAERQLRRQFEYEALVLRRVAEDEGLAVLAAIRKAIDHAGEIPEDIEREIFDSSFRAWHIAQLIHRGEESGRRVWAFDVVGTCLVKAGVTVPDTFISTSDIKEMVNAAMVKAGLK